MAIESAADRAVFLSSADFGVVAVYTPKAGGAPSNINVIFDAAWAEINIGLDVPVSETGPRLVVQSADLSLGGRQADVFVIAGVTYKATDIQPDGTGMTTVKLEKQ